MTYFKTGDVDDLSKKISYLINNPELAAQMAERAYKKLKESYVWSVIADQYNDLYEKLL